MSGLIVPEDSEYAIKPPEGEEVKVSSLVQRLMAWVEQQPEYPYLFLADRARRRRAADIIAKSLLTIPKGEPRQVLINKGGIDVPVTLPGRKALRAGRKLAAKQAKQVARSQMRAVAKAMDAMAKEEEERNEADS